MIVYVCLRMIHHEGGDYIGVAATLKAAIKKCKSHYDYSKDESSPPLSAHSFYIEDDGYYLFDTPEGYCYAVIREKVSA